MRAHNQNLEKSERDGRWWMICSALNFTSLLSKTLFSIFKTVDVSAAAQCTVLFLFVIFLRSKIAERDVTMMLIFRRTIKAVILIKVPRQSAVHKM